MNNKNLQATMHFAWRAVSGKEARETITVSHVESYMASNYALFQWWSNGVSGEWRIVPMNYHPESAECEFSYLTEPHPASKVVNGHNVCEEHSAIAD